MKAGWAVALFVTLTVLTAIYILYIIVSGMPKEEEMFHYFAYGSNLFSKRILLSNPSAVFKSVGLLKGYRLEFTLPSNRWGGAAGNVYPDPNSNVYGVVWELSQEDAKSLEIQEDAYVSFEPTIELSNGSMLRCKCYQLSTERREKGLVKLGRDNLIPSVSYKRMLVLGAKENKLPEDYIRFLENYPDTGEDVILDPEIAKRLN